MVITRINPPTLSANPAFTQVAVVDRPAQWIFIGGQNGVTAEGKIVGNDIASQTEQSFRNVIAALTAADAGLSDVVKMTIYIVAGQSLRDGFAAAQKLGVIGATPPTISVLVVAGLANPDYLVEIDAVAVKERP